MKQITAIVKPFKLEEVREALAAVGVTGLTLNRADFYENEVTFQVSRSYGSADASDPSSARAKFDEIVDFAGVE
jgi:hypothetical protein